MRADTVTFQPFVGGAKKYAIMKGAETKRTPIVPPRLMFDLLEVAATIVSEPKEVFRGVQLTDDHLSIACWILIASLTARRAEEIAELEPDCLVGNDEVGWMLRVYIAKTEKQKSLIPIPRLVVRAVQTMLALSEDARTAGDKNALFLKFNRNGDVIENRIGRKLDLFCETFGVQPQQAEVKGPAELWHWTPHQFRRFFALLYFYRSEAPSIEVLSHHLRHTNLAMTNRYITQDPDLAALWTDVQWGYAGHIARRIAAGDKSIGGGRGERLKKTMSKIKDILRRNLQVIRPERLASLLKTVMERDGLFLDPKPWGAICTCPRTQKGAQLASCRRSQGAVPLDATGPDFSRAGPLVCRNGCPHAIIDERNEKVLAAERDHLDAAVSSSSRAGSLFGELERHRLLEIRSALDVTHREVVGRA